MTAALACVWRRSLLPLLAGFAFAARAQETLPPLVPPPERAYTHRAWNRDDGLPDNAAERLLLTRDGWLWIGTRSGLARFDGLKFTVYDGRTPGFTDDAILDLAEDAAGSLWIATKRGLYRKQGGEFRQFTRADGLAHDHITDLHPAPDGSLWVATQGGLNQFERGSLSSFPFEETIDDLFEGPRLSRRIPAVTRLPSGEVIIGTLTGAHQFDLSGGPPRFLWPPPVPTNLVRGAVVNALFVDRAERPWAGIDDFLACRESDRWREWRFPPDAGDTRTRRICQDEAGTIWVARGGRLFRIVGDALEPHADPHGLRDAFISDVLPDGQGGLWLGTRFAGLHHLKPAPLRLFTTRDGLCHNTVVSVTPRRAGGVWVATARGFMSFDNGRFEFPSVPPAEAPVRELSGRVIFEDSTGDVWVIQQAEPTAQPGMFRQFFWLEPVAGTYRRLEADVGTLGITTLAEDRHGRLWIAGRQGLACLLTNYLAQANSGPNQNPPSVLGATVHRKRATRWLFESDKMGKATGQGWFYLKPGQWQLATEVNPPWFPLAQAPPELLADAPIPPDQRFSSEEIRAILHTRDGTLWFGTWGGGLNRLRDGKITVLTTRDGLPGDHLHCLHEDTDGHLWLGTTRGLTRLNPRSSRGNEAMAQRGTQNAERGIGQSGLPSAPTPARVGDEVTSLRSSRTPDAKPQTQSSQSLLTSAATEDTFTFSFAHGLPSEDIHQILEDDAGNFWIGSGRGIFRVARSALNEVATGKAARAECLLFDEEDGLTAGETATGAQPAACRTPDGRLWFATPQGLAMIDPVTVVTHRPTPKVILETLRTADHTYPLVDAAVPHPSATSSRDLRSSDHPSPALRAPSPFLGGGERDGVRGAPLSGSGARFVEARSGNLSERMGASRGEGGNPSPATRHPSLLLPPGSGHTLTIEFTALEHAAPRRLRFRYRLAGHDPGWVEAGVRRTAFYTNLKPHDYRFQVQAAGRDSRWTEPGETLAFAIAPFYWQTRWFQSGVVLLLLLSLVLFLRWRFRQLKRLERAESVASLARQREGIARDLHDDLGSRLAQISLLGELTARDPAQAARVATLARETAQNLDGLVWTVHPERDSLNHLAAYLGQSAHEFLAPAGLELELDFPPSVPAVPLPAPARKAVLLATKEALHNVVKHAAARHVRLALELGEGSFTVTVEDDGCGLAQGGGLSSPPNSILEPPSPEPRPSARGHGLANMQRRLAEIGGRCDLGPRPGGGTRVTLSVPLPTHSS